MKILITVLLGILTGFLIYKIVNSKSSEDILSCNCSLDITVDNPLKNMWKRLSTKIKQLLLYIKTTVKKLIKRK